MRKMFFEEGQLKTSEENFLSSKSAEFYLRETRKLSDK